MKHNNEKKRLMNGRKKSVWFIGALLICLIVTVGGSLAYLVASSDKIVNTFAPSEITIEVTEDVSGDVKNDVKIANTGNTEAYIRAAVIVTWQDEAGNVYGAAPVEGTD